MKPSADSRKTFRIGELAARSGRSVHAIRWYERQGLIPGVMRDPGGRRVYTERHASWLTLIDRLRVTGMSIAQMRAYAVLVRRGKSSLAEQRALLKAHRANVMQTISEWNEALRLLDRKVAFYDEWLETGQRPAREPEAPEPGRRVARRRLGPTREAAVR
jgi:DNA-binding transcriptional MerR regulator